MTPIKFRALDKSGNFVFGCGVQITDFDFDVLLVNAKESPLIQKNPKTFFTNRFLKQVLMTRLFKRIITSVAVKREHGFGNFAERFPLTLEIKTREISHYIYNKV